MAGAERKTVTLKMIAEMAGCSTAVVSTVLNGSRGNTKVSEKTSQRIREIAERENYRPNFASRSLKKSSSRTLGVYVQPNVWHGLGLVYEMSIFKGIERAAMELRYDLLILNMSCDAAAAVCAEKLAEHRIDGVLLLHADTDAEWLNALAAEHANVVAIDYNKPEAGFEVVSFDNTAAVHTALRHLLELGHRRIGFIGHGTARAEWDTLEREEAFRAAKGHPDFAELELLFYSATDIPEDSLYCQLEGENGMRYFLECPQRPSAVVAYNALVGLYARRTAQKSGLHVPDDLSIIGIDRPDFSSWQELELTSIDHPLSDMGDAAARLLIAKIENADHTAIPRRFSGTLIASGTTASNAKEKL